MSWLDRVLSLGDKYTPQYGIAYIVSAGVNKDGKPLPHLRYRMEKAQKMKENNEIQKILIGNGVRSLADDMTKYLIEELYIPPSDICTVYDGFGTAGEMLYGRKKVEQLISEKSIPSNVKFHVITTDWASERTELISDRILSSYEHEVIGTPDGRKEWIRDKARRMIVEDKRTEEAEKMIEKVDEEVETDISFEPMKAGMYKWIVKIPLIVENNRMLALSEMLFSIRYPKLLWAYVKEFSKKLKGQEIYSSSEDVYS